MDPEQATQTNIISLALQYVDDSILRSTFVSPTYNHVEKTEPKPNRAFLTEPEEAWTVHFDTRILSMNNQQFGAVSDRANMGWKQTQLIVEIGRRGDVFSVERHYQAAPVNTNRQLQTEQFATA